MKTTPTPPRDGGPAFPYVTTKDTDAYCVGLSKRDWLAAQAPRGEIEDMAPATASTCAEFLGMDETKKYDGAIHYKLVLAKLRYQWADAMLAERAKTTEGSK